MRSCTYGWVLVGLVAMSAGGCGGSSGSSGGLSWLGPNLGGGRTVSHTEKNNPSGPREWDVKSNRPWRYIVIHHSASDKGNAATIDAYHRNVRGWNGLGYHFVIDNGNGGPDGRVEVGYRWKNQEYGAHTGNTPGNGHNKYGIGISLVGNFQDKSPSPAQLAAMEKLVFYLADKYDISPTDVIGHRDAPGAKTDCPGDRLHAYVHKTLRPKLARHLGK